METPVEYPPAIEALTERARRAIRVVLGDSYSPAIFILGATPRSGTVYAGELVRLHTDVSAYPNQLWEVPFLRGIGPLLQHQADFFQAYKLNRSRMGANDLVGLYAASLLAYLQSFIPAGKRMLVKDTALDYLPYFPVLFPSEFAVILLRDGRDTVHSTLRTWPNRYTFPEVCERWNKNARLALDFSTACRNESRYWLVHYEDVLADPNAFVTELCRRFELAPERYPFDRIDTVEVLGSSTLVSPGAVDWNPTPRPPEFQPTRHWTTWTRGQREQFAEIAGDTLLEASYCADMDWVTDNPH